MFAANAGAMAAPLTVTVADGRTKSADEWAQEITDKIMSVGDSAPRPIRDQAIAFKAQIYRVVRDNIALALEHEREWLLNQRT